MYVNISDSVCIDLSKLNLSKHSSKIVLTQANHRKPYRIRTFELSELHNKLATLGLRRLGGHNFEHNKAILGIEHNAGIIRVCRQSVSIIICFDEIWVCLLAS